MTDPAAPRCFHGRRLEPAEPVVLHGAGQTTPGWLGEPPPEDPNEQAVGDYITALGEPLAPIIYMAYCGMRHDPAVFARRLGARLAALPGYAVAQIGLSVCRPGQKTREVANGANDDALRRFCDAVRQVGRPAFVRIAFEFNGPWHSYPPDAYGDMWRHVVGLFRSEGLDDVATIWCYASEPTTLETMMDWYPGDEWVDWWGIDLFSREHFTAPDTERFMTQAREHGFPVMIGESSPRYVGVLDGSGSWDLWFAPYFRFIRRWDHLRAACYISWDWSPYKIWSDWGDGRIQQDETVLARYREAISAPLFAHARDEAATRALLRARPAAGAADMKDKE